MKILITGGAGFIGSHIADLLIEEGHDIVILDNLSNGKEENVNPKAIFYHLNILDKKLADIFKNEKIEVVIHHAAQISVRDSVKDPIHDMETNIRGSLLLLEHCVKYKYNIKKFIFASTGGALYGEQEYSPADENHPTRPLSPYAVAKLSTEKYLFFYHNTYNLPYISLRYANVYGPRQDPYGEAGVVAIFTQQILQGKQPVINGDGKQTRDFIHVYDVAKANLLALKHEVIGEINISTGIETSINQIFYEIKKLTSSNSSEIHGPPMPGEQLRSVLSFKKAKRVLGWEPSTPLTEGLKNTVKFFQKKDLN
jgi:UDP-glucose 4-epimerase